MTLTNKTYSSINIIGAGCIGHLLALSLIKQNSLPVNNIRLYSRSKQKPKEIVYLSEYLEFKTKLNYYALSEWHPADLDIICVKTPQLPLVCAELVKMKDLVTAVSLNLETPILLMMNGMGVLELVSLHFPDQPILQGISTHGAKFDNNQLIHSGQGVTKIGGFPHKSLGIHQKQLKQLFLHALPKVIISKNIQSDLWEKLFINAVINPLTALYKVKNGAIIKDLEINSLVIDLCAEIEIFNQKLGASKTDISLYQLVKSVCHATRNNKSSMFQDHLSKNKSEIDAITGYMLTQAKVFQIDMPKHKKIFRKIKRLENQF